jgi:kynurenine formamidase
MTTDDSARSGDAPAVAGEGAGTDRRGFVRTAAAATGAVAGTVAGKFSLAPVSTAQAQESMHQPWWPSKWGADDEAGSTNHVTPRKVLEAVRGIAEGRVYKLGRTYEAGMPFFGTRVMALRIPGAPTGGPFGKNKLVYHDEFVTAELGQVGTQFDGLGHIGIQMGADGDKKEMRYYNGHTEEEIGKATGLAKLGVEKLKPIVTSAHLVDVAALKGRMLDAGEEITVQDVRDTLAKQGMSEGDIRPGDAILFHTGWGSLWMQNNDRFNSGEPGIGMEVAEWVVEKDLCLTGADTWAVEVVPNPDPELAFVVHGHLQTKHGIVNHENLVFDELLADRRYRFVYVFAPVPLKGATGSCGCPIAIT